MRRLTAILTGLMLIIITTVSGTAVYAVNQSDNTDPTVYTYHRNNDNEQTPESDEQDATGATESTEAGSTDNSGDEEDIPTPSKSKVDTSWFDYKNKKKTYTIKTEAQLRGLASLVNEKQAAWKPNHTENFRNTKFVLANDIKLSGPWAPIGHGSSYSFQGTFDGNNHTISGLKIGTGYDYSGFFGYLKGSVVNLNVEGKVASNNPCTGTIAGRIDASATITGCTTHATVTGKDKTGGIVGESKGGTVELCKNRGKVNGTYKVGGVVGENFGGKIIKSGNSAEIKSTTRNLGIYGTGGVAGRAVSDGSVVRECYNTGSIISETEGTGGVVGFANARGSRIVSSYNTGNIVVKAAEEGKKKSKAYSGGVAGIVCDNEVIIANCYNIGTSLGADVSGGVVGYYTDKNNQPPKLHITNNYFVNSQYKWGIGIINDSQGATIEDCAVGISLGALKNASGRLSSKFRNDSSGIYGNAGYPVLRWQDKLSEDDKEYLKGISVDAQKRLDNYMTKHVDSLMVGEIIINIFNTTNLLQNSIKLSGDK